MWSQMGWVAKGVAFVLFLITLIVNAIARWLVWQVSRNASGRTA